MDFDRNHYLAFQILPQHPIRPQNHLKTIFSYFFFLISLFAFGGFWSCSGRKTSQLVPDSCRSLVRVNMPSLAAKLLINKELLDSLRSQTGFQLQDMGLDFFQDAFVFERVEEGSPVRYALFGLSDKEKFGNALKTRWPGLNIEAKDQNQIAWFQRFCLVWNDQFAVGRYFNSMLSPKIDVAPLVALLQSDLPAGRNFNLPDSSDFSFRWTVGEPAPMALLPPFECKIQGTASLDNFDFRLSAQVEEQQYFAFLEPFKSRPMPFNFGGLKIEFLPALSPIWQQYEALHGGSYVDDQMSSVVSALGDVDAPYTLFIPETGMADPLHQAEFWAHFKNENTAQLLQHNLSSQLRPFLDFNHDTLSNSGNEIVLHPLGRKPIFWTSHFSSTAGKNSENQPNILFPEDILSVVLRNENARFVFEMKKNGTDSYQVGLESSNFHKLRLMPFLNRLETGMDDFVPPTLP